MQARTLKIIAALLIISALFKGIIGYKISQQEIKRVEPTTATSTSSDYVYAQKLLVTTRTLAQGDTLTAEDLTLTPFPVKVEDSFGRVADAVGKTVEFDIAKGEVLRASHFEKKSTLTQLIEPGHRALAVKVDEVVGTGGFLQPGDHAQQCRLAAAGRPDEHDELTMLDLDVHALDDVDRAIALLDPLQQHVSHEPPSQERCD